MKQAKYVGTNRRFKGHKALWRPSSKLSMCLVQFDDTTMRKDINAPATVDNLYGFNWHPFPASDWELIDLDA